MVFSSLLFLFYFLPITLLFYFLSPRKWKNFTLLILSIIFYAWGEPVYVLLIIFSAVVDYFLGRLIGRSVNLNKRKAQWLLALSIAVNIGVLSFFKYADFLISNINALFGLQVEALNLPLPIGISFYTFQTMSYVIDVYRGKITPQRSFISFSMYVTLFPQLIAGPIVRYETIQSQMTDRVITFSSFSSGLKLFLIGLGKKVLLANNIGMLWQEISTQPFSELSVATAWLGIIAFSLQIYFDFSGYSDMAVGLGRMLGFEFPPNFNYPYLSKSIAEFWRRWHITLGSWFREYVYIPLGGNRKGNARTYVNVLIVWFLTGVWHGASWNFILWGLYFGVFIAIERAFLQKWLNRIPELFQHLYFIFFILIGWVLFVFEDFQLMFGYLGTMFGLQATTILDETALYYLSSYGVLLCVGLAGSLPVFQYVKRVISRLKGLAVITPILYFILLLFVTAYLVDDSYNPFLYFRF